MASKISVMRNTGGKINIGSIIHESLFGLNLSLYEISERMNIPKKDILRLSRIKSMDLDIIYSWSCFSKINYFDIYSNFLYEDVKNIEEDTESHNFKFKSKKF